MLALSSIILTQSSPQLEEGEVPFSGSLMEAFGVKRFLSIVSVNLKGAGPLNYISPGSRRQKPL